MLAHTGRNVVQDEAYRDMWSVVTVPLSEWDGVIPRRSARPAVAWARDDPSGRFIPQYKQL
jgi:hypothetical protein